MLTPFRLTPEYRDYVWGGERLRPGYAPTAEAWIVHAGDRITDGVLAGHTLGEAAAEWGAGLIGEHGMARRSPERGENDFPLLIKLLDCAGWLSLQVHPDDEQAVALEGPGQVGKTEAWHVVDATPGAEILCGLRVAVPPHELAQAVRQGTVLDIARRMPVQTGDTLFIPPGTLHALGPGLLVYEIQQPSDLTYRVFDWNRPASAGRALHIEQSLAVLDPAAVVEPLRAQAVAAAPTLRTRRLAACNYFHLTLVDGEGGSIDLDTGRLSFHAVTVLEGQARLHGAGWEQHLTRFETLLIPAACGAYAVEAKSSLHALVAGV